MLKNILLIDDDPDEAELFRDALSDIDPSISFDFAISGKSALMSLAKSKMNPDIIFLDINMPEMDGWECLRQLKAMPACQNIPVYMYSTSRNDNDRQSALEIGAVTLITKYDNFRKFKDSIASILSGRSIYSPSVGRTGFIGSSHIFNIRLGVSWFRIRILASASGGALVKALCFYRRFTD